MAQASPETYNLSSSALKALGQPPIEAIGGQPAVVLRETKERMFAA